jgi:uncharacterized protein YcbK (DUF882 family)
MITRRKFLKSCLIGASLFSFHTAFASTATDRILNMENIHTGEHLNIQYCFSGVYDDEALEKINYFLRCHYTNEVMRIDVRVLDFLCDIKDFIGRQRPIQIISGYRSDIYNDKLIQEGRNVSKKSLHLRGCAIDFAFEGVSSGRITRIAQSFRAGGVGKYPKFVHVDVGRVRSW